MLRSTSEVATQQQQFSKKFQISPETPPLEMFEIWKSVTVKSSL